MQDDVRTPLLEMVRWAVKNHRDLVCGYLRLTCMMEEQARAAREFKLGIQSMERRERHSCVSNIVDDECQRAKRLFDSLPSPFRERSISILNNSVVARLVAPRIDTALALRRSFARVPVPMPVSRVRSVFSRDHVRKCPITNFCVMC